MPCNMFGDNPTADFASNRADEALRRVRELEQALCGLCQQLSTEGRNMHPQLHEWFMKHANRLGCVARTE